MHLTLFIGLAMQCLFFWLTEIMKADDDYSLAPENNWSSIHSGSGSLGDQSNPHSSNNDDEKSDDNEGLRHAPK
jgi:hypothetical protein